MKTETTNAVHCFREECGVDPHSSDVHSRTTTYSSLAI